MKKIWIVAMLLAVILTVRPRQPGLVPGIIGTFQENANEQLLMYYDFDRNQRIDIMTKSIDRKSGDSFINFYLWDQGGKEYLLSGSVPIASYVGLESTVVSTFGVSEQFRLVLYSNTEEKGGYIEVRPFECVDFECVVGQPMKIQEINSDLDDITPTLISLKGQPCLLFQSRSKALLLSFTTANQYTITPLKDILQSKDDIKYQYTFNGDYNGDCWTDLILLDRNKQNSQSILYFYQGNMHNQYSFVEEWTVKDNVVHFTVQDINFDAKNDLLLLLASGNLQVHYHKTPQTPSKTLCTGTQKPYILDTSTPQSPDEIQHINLQAKPSQTSVLLFQDFNNDGYEDLTVTLLNTQTQLPFASLFQNVPCIDQTCGQYSQLLLKHSTTNHLRNFQMKILPNVSSVITRLSFLDFYQDGTLDILAQIQIQDEKGKYLTIQPIYNNVDYDAFFLTLTLLSHRTNVNLMKNTQFIGGCSSFYVTLLSGQLTPKTNSQMAQTGSSLTLPYTRCGLGRTNNYLSTLTIHLPVETTQNKTNLVKYVWTPIIPNSDILIVPPPLKATLEIPQQWFLEILIEPTEKMFMVCFFVMVTLVVMGAVIMHLNKKESEEDQEEQKMFYTIFG